MALADLLELYISLGIFLLAGALSGISYLAARREHDRRMVVVTAGYGMFAVYGLVVALEQLFVGYISYETFEIVEHGSALLILAGLLTFFVALARD